MNDEIIQELNAIKDALATEFNSDLRLIFADIKRGEKELQAAGFALEHPLQTVLIRQVQHYSDPVFLIGKRQYKEAGTGAGQSQAIHPV